MSNHPDRGDISLKGFTSASHGTDFAAYTSALESFDRLEQLQELKALGRERTGIGPGARVLEVGCGFGLVFVSPGWVDRKVWLIVQPWAILDGVLKVTAGGQVCFT
jgi:hypothetical protein